MRCWLGKGVRDHSIRDQMVTLNAGFMECFTKYLIAIDAFGTDVR